MKFMITILINSFKVKQVILRRLFGRIHQKQDLAFNIQMMDIMFL
ncbi:unnamed protein product [Schistosoma mattheei]|uniref:Uncharacterized protein n=1 Tax=Schistosoma mattheei TaxID=31246 RepID=A0A183Q351_9TREM|nr:unnamed protein product [Schistosoma mattheei]